MKDDHSFHHLSDADLEVIDAAIEALRQKFQAIADDLIRRGVKLKLRLDEGKDVLFTDELAEAMGYAGPVPSDFELEFMDTRQRLVLQLRPRLEKLRRLKELLAAVVHALNEKCVDDSVRSYHALRAAGLGDELVPAYEALQFERSREGQLILNAPEPGPMRH